MTEAFRNGRTERRGKRRFSLYASGASIALTMLLIACTDLLHDPAPPPGTALVLKFAASADSAAVERQPPAAAPALADDSTSSTNAADVPNRGDATGDALPRDSDGEGPRPAFAEVFAEIDEVRVRILRDETVARDTTVQLPPEGGDTRVRIELDVQGDAETVGVAVELLVDGEPAYSDDVMVSVDPGGTTEVEVDPEPIPAEVRIDETELELAGIGESIQLTGEIVAVTGEPIEGLELTWETLDAEIVSVTPGGLLTALDEGVARVVGSHGAFSDTVNVSVQRLVEVVVVEPSEATLVEGETHQFSATLLDSEDNPVSGRSVTWTSSAETVATVDGSGLVRAVSGGEAAIVAAIGGLADTAEVIVVAEQYRLTVETAGNGAGTVTSEPAGISCGDDCGEIYDDGTGVVLTATPANGASFDSWSNCPDASGNTCTVNMTAARTISATFVANDYVLTVERDGNGTGTVTAEPGGVSCGDNCSETYDHGTRVVLTATPANGSSFESWSNCPDASGNTCTVNVTAPRTVSATFTVNRHVLTVERGGNGTGTVTAEPGDISCGDDCSETYDHGTRVVLTAAPANGSSFESWSNCPDASGNTCAVTLTAARTITAIFAPTPVDRVTIEPHADTILVRETRQLRARMFDRDGNELGGRRVSWTSSNVQVATVSDSGRVTGLAPGEVTITATSEDVRGSASITVVQAEPDLVVSSIEVTGEIRIDNNQILVPVRVVVRNQGTAAADIFKVATEYTGPLGGPFVVAFTVPGQSSLWYPFTDRTLLVRSSVSFSGTVTFSSSRSGEVVRLAAIADSCSGEEFVPEYCRVDESNEGNNRSGEISVSLPHILLDSEDSRARLTGSNDRR